MPNAAHLHLILVHSSPTLLWIGLLLCTVSYFHPNEKAIRLVTLVVVLMAAFGLVAAANSGEAAVDMIEGEPSFDKGVVHDHEEAGELLFPFALASAFLVLIWFTLSRKKEHHVRGWAWWASIVLLVGTASLATYASNLGGKIRHPEAQKGWVVEPADSSGTPIVNRDSDDNNDDENGEH